jgi:hypothetical protein
MDKEPTVAGNYLWAITSGGVAVVAWRWRWWAGALVSILTLLGVWAVCQEINDPFVGAAIEAEAGRLYATNFYLSVSIGIALHVLAAYLGLRARGVLGARTA